MRTTLRLDPQLLARAKQIAAERGTTLAAVIEDALRQSLNGKGAARRHRRTRIPTFPGKGGLQPGVDLDDSASLLGLMESDRDSERRERTGVRVSRRRG